MCVAFFNTAGARRNDTQQGVTSYAELVARRHIGCPAGYLPFWGPGSDLL